MDLANILIVLIIVGYLMVGRGMVLWERHVNGNWIEGSVMFVLPLHCFVKYVEVCVRGERDLMENLMEDDDKDE